MAGKIFCPLLKSLQLLPRAKCLQIEYVIWNRRKILSTNSGYFNVSFSNLSIIDTGDKSTTYSEANIQPKSWLLQYKDFVHQLNTNGFDKLDIKFVPVKKMKYQAEGETVSLIFAPLILIFIQNIRKMLRTKNRPL